MGTVGGGGGGGGGGGLSQGCGYSGNSSWWYRWGSAPIIATFCPLYRDLTISLAFRKIFRLFFLTQLQIETRATGIARLQHRMGPTGFDFLPQSRVVHREVGLHQFLSLFGGVHKSRPGVCCVPPTTYGNCLSIALHASSASYAIASSRPGRAASLKARELGRRALAHCAHT